MNERTAMLIDEIGQIAYVDLDEKTNSFFLYALCDAGVIATGLFYRADPESSIQYVDASQSLKRKSTRFGRT